jgi:hypothetical protein
MLLRALEFEGFLVQIYAALLEYLSNCTNESADPL